MYRKGSRLGTLIVKKKLDEGAMKKAKKKESLKGNWDYNAVM